MNGDKKMKVAIGTDHRGREIKETIISRLASEIEFIDCSVENHDTDDYPDFAFPCCKSIIDKKNEVGVLICGTGIGMSMAANKVKGIRAAVCTDHFSVKFTRLHNNANVLCLGGRVLGDLFALELLDIFLNTEYEGGRHQNRLDKIAAIEEENA